MKLSTNMNLVLLPKPGKPPNLPGSYRPLCLLDVAGKLAKQLIRSRQIDELERTDALSPHQFGFLKGRSTMEAIDQVMEKVKAAAAGTWRTR